MPQLRVSEPILGLNNRPVNYMIRIMYIFLQQLNMENIMLFYCGRKCQPISYRSHSIQNFKRSTISRCQLGTNSHPRGTLPGTNSDIDVVSRLEFFGGSLSVSITFLSILSDFQILLYLNHLLFHFFQYVRSDCNSIHWITPADWSLTLSTIDGFERDHLH